MLYQNGCIVILQDPSQADGGNYIVRAVNEVGDKDCTLALNFGKFRINNCYL